MRKLTALDGIALGLLLAWLTSCTPLTPNEAIYLSNQVGYYNQMYYAHQPICTTYQVNTYNPGQVTRTVCN